MSLYVQRCKVKLKTDSSYNYFSLKFTYNNEIDLINSLIKMFHTKRKSKKNIHSFATLADYSWFCGNFISDIEISCY